LILLALFVPVKAEIPTRVSKYAFNPIYDENGNRNVRWVNVQYDDGTYYLYYSHSGGPTDSYYATSTDGLNFSFQGYAIKRDSNASAWDSGYVEIHSVFKYDATHWILYYCGAPVNGWWGIGCAFSTDLKKWTKYAGNPILREEIPVEPTSLLCGSEPIHGADPNVIRISNGTFLMYYANYDSRNAWQISLATSLNGLSWTNIGTVLTYNSKISWCSYYVAPTGVFEIDNKIYLMVVGKSAETQKVQNGLFECNDWTGTSFHETFTEPSPCIPIVEHTWESNMIEHSDFETVNGVTYIYYVGSDGVNWQLGRANIQMNSSVPEMLALPSIVIFAISFVAIVMRKRIRRLCR
jgi:hypothetical protein